MTTGVIGLQLPSLTVEFNHHLKPLILSDSPTKCPEAIHSYFSFGNELSVTNGIILKGHSRIVIPESLWLQAINILHNKGHLGLSKTLERVRTCMYWPGITDAIKDSISSCKVCLTFLDRQQREPYISDTVTQP